MKNEDIAKLAHSEATVNRLHKEWEVSGKLTYSDMMLLWATVSAVCADYRAAIEFYEDERLEGLSRSEYE